MTDRGAEVADSADSAAAPERPALDPTRTNLTDAGRLADGRLLAGRYRVLGMLGMGAMGLVYRARDEELDLEVALKVLRPEFGGDEKLLERFRRELLLARQVTHKHVVRIHDIGRDGDLVFLTMDLVAGRSLRQLLDEKGSLPLGQAVAYAGQLARALAAAHGEGVIHRDLKPSNVMVDEAGNAYITDFGVARSVASAGLTRTGFVVGTPDYLSPEQARGEEIDGRSDVYALGVLLFELLAGKLPLSGSTPDETLAQHLSGVPRRLAGLPREVPSNLRAILRRSLEPDRRRRYPDAAALAADLEQLSRPPRRLPSGRRLALAGLVAGLLVAAVAALYLVRSAAPPGAESSAPGATAVVILPFADETGRGDLAWLSTGVPELLFESMIGQPEIRMVNPQRVARAVADLKLEPGAFSEATLQLASELFDSSRLLTGSIRTATDGGIRIDARLVDPAAGPAAPTFLHAEAPAGPRAATEVVAELRTELLASLAIRQPVADAPPSSPALPQYAEGVQQLWRGDAIAARALLEEAVQVDAEFGAGWLRLSQAYEAMGQLEQAFEAADRAVAELDGAAPGGDRFRLLARAQQARLSGEPARAQEILAQLVEGYPADVESAVELADAYGIAGQYAQALDLLARVVERAPANAQAWFLRAKYAILSGQSRLAVDEYLVRAMVLQNKLKNQQGQADVMNAFGVAYRELGEMAQAEESYQRAAELRRQIGDDRGYATSLRNLAQIAIYRGDFPAAEGRLREAQQIFEALGDQAGIADLYNELGMMEEARSDYRRALANFREALQLRRESGDRRAIGESLNNIGFANHQLGNYDDASVYWQQALDLYLETGNVEGQVTVRQSLGQLYTTQGGWQQAQQSLLEALEGARELAWEPAIATADGYLGRVAQYQGRYAAALSHYDDALARFAAMDDARGRVEFSLARAETLLELGASAQAQEALAAIEEPLAAVGTADQRAEALHLRGRALVLAGEDAAAGRALREAAAAAADSANRGLRLRLRLFEPATAGSIARLEELLSEIRSLGEKRLEVRAELALAEALLAGDRTDDAARAVTRIERLMRRGGDWALAWRVHALRAELARRRGEDATAWRASAERELERVSDGLPTDLARRFREHAGRGEAADAA